MRMNTFPQSLRTYIKVKFPKDFGYKNHFSMAKHSTYPTLYEDCSYISISYLQKHRLLIPGKDTSGEILWERDGEVIGRVSIKIVMNVALPHLFDPFMQLSYSVKGIPVNYSIQLTSKPSNIGKGVVWYFICHFTGKKCRVLYLVGDCFAHRVYATGYAYEAQILSKNQRQDLLRKDVEAEKVFKELNSKHFKKYYKGKPTKRYVSYLKKLGIEEHQM